MNTLVNAGESDYNALQLQLEKRFSKNYSSRVSYTLAKGTANFSTDGTAGSNLQYLDDLRLDAERGADGVRSPAQLRRRAAWRSCRRRAG